MTGAESAAGFAMKIFMKEHQVPPMGIRGKAAVFSKAGAAATRIRDEDRCQPGGNLGGHFREIHHSAGPFGTFDFQRISIEVPIALQRLNQQIVFRNQIGPRQLELPPKAPVVDSPGT